MVPMMSIEKRPAGEVSTLSVVVIEDDRRTQEGLGMLINGVPGYRCVGAFTRVEDALATKVTGSPDVILLDIDLPGIPGPEGVKVLIDRFPRVQVVMLTVYTDPAKVFDAICNGACGYLLKDTPPVRLIESIREAATGGAPMSPEVARLVVTRLRQTNPARQTDANLTAQEIRLLQLLSDGYSYEGAASQLEITINTVRNYIRSIYDKLHVHTRSEAVSKALRNRVIS
jgi:DNA-binding NarL/FixJ family response regulator